LSDITQTPAELAEYHNLVAGQRVMADSGEWLDSFNPYTGQPWARIPRCGASDIDSAVAAAKAAFQDPAWRGLTATQRGKLLFKVADLIEQHSDRFAELETQDNGKLITETTPLIKYLADWYRYFGGLADKIEGAVLPMDKPSNFVYTRHEPLGVIAAITAWNSPLMLLTWKLAPLLAAGNTVVIKPSEHASVSTLEFVELFVEAGFPVGVINTVTGLGNEAGEALAAHPDVAKVAFTGGEKGGKSVFETAAHNLTQVSLELGGKSANIIFDDANLDAAVNGAVAGIFAATGQTCIAGSRLLVQKSVHDQVVEQLVEFASAAKMGSPTETTTQVGPITTKPQYNHVLSMIEKGHADGATCALGGKAADSEECGNGWFVEPTVFTGVSNEMRIAQEEVFGPVLSVIPFEDEADAIRIANDSLYGLASGIWTSDIGRAIRVSNAMESGTVWVNTYRAVSFIAPFGGYKNSGIGRENGQEAIFEFLQTKTVWMETELKTGNPFLMK